MLRNNIFSKDIFLAKSVLAMALFVMALILSGVIEAWLPIKTYFPFTGLILLVFVTWVLYKLEGKNLNQLGINRKWTTIRLFIFGVVIGLVANFIANVLKIIYTGQELHFNELVDIKIMLLGVYYLMAMVAVEEFLFRAYLFQMVIEKSSVIIANILFSTIFMLVHVLDSEVLSSVGKIIFLSITIPVGHLFFATALIKSKTILFPIGLHLGNNWSTKHLFSNHQNESSILFTSGSSTFETWSEFIPFILLWNGFYLLIIYIIWKWPEKR